MYCWHLFVTTFVAAYLALQQDLCIELRVTEAPHQVKLLQLYNRRVKVPLQRETTGLDGLGSTGFRNVLLVGFGSTGLEMYELVLD